MRCPLAVLLTAFFLLAVAGAAWGQGAAGPSADPDPIVLEAEQASLGGELKVGQDGPVRYVTAKTVGGGEHPGSRERVMGFDVQFSRAGTYEVYARVRVGPDGIDDDSLFLARGFGIQRPRAPGDWISINGLGQQGFSSPDAIVDFGEEANAGPWKWVALSQIAEAPVGHALSVADFKLSQHLELAAREDGLDVDKLVLVPRGFNQTVADLDAGRLGRRRQQQPEAPPFEPKGPPLAQGKSKYLGGVYSASQATNLTAYFNQVTPENAGKWGRVEATRDVMVWDELDAAYRLAKQYGYAFRMHVLIWGNQQPAWIEGLPAEEQLREIEQWFAAVAARYPDLDYLEVVNEPLHDPPDKPGEGGGDYLKALGGEGETGWDWVLSSFRLARRHFPGVRLVLNDYDIVNEEANAARYLRLIELLQAERLIDAIGVQCHSFSTRAEVSVMRGNLDRLAGTGLPLIVTEMDIDGADDAVQLAEYQRVFPVFWEHPAVEGITLWGYRPGMWRTAQGAYLALENGAERPALQWLRGYVQNDPPWVAARQSFVVSEAAEVGAALGFVQAFDGQGSSPSGFEIVGGASEIFRIEPATGELSLNGALDHEWRSTHELSIRARDEYSVSEPVVVQVRVVNLNDSPPEVLPHQSLRVDRGAGRFIGRLRAVDPDDRNQPGFSDLHGYRLVGGSSAYHFVVDSVSGALWLRDPTTFDWWTTKHPIDVVVSDGRHQSVPARIFVEVPEKVNMCLHGYDIEVPRERVYRKFPRGARLGRCSTHMERARY